MNKKTSALAIAGLMLSSTYAQADMAGIEVGAYQWSPDYSGYIAVNGSSSGTELNLVDDLGYTDEDHNIIWASVEHPLPFIPNFKIVSSDLDASASFNFTDPVDFGDEFVGFTGAGTTTIDMSNIEYTLYYEFLDNWINVDAGLTIRKYDGAVSMNADSDPALAESETIDYTIPLLYLKGRVDLPLTGFFVDGEMNVINYSDYTVSDLSFSVGYESDIGLGAKAGYRTFTLEVDESDFISDLEFKGAYLSVFFHF